MINFFLLVMSFSAIAVADDCRVKLIGNGQDYVDSMSITLTSDEAPLEEIPHAAIYFVERAAKERGCEDITEPQLDPGTESCSTLSKNRSWSTVCYVEGKIGYFFVMQDMLGVVRVIANRWD